MYSNKIISANFSTPNTKNDVNTLRKIETDDIIFNVKNKLDYENSKEYLSAEKIESNNNFKTLILKVIDAKYLPYGYRINISPLGINGKEMINKDKYVFGKDCLTNDFNFSSEENVGKRQFEIKIDKKNQFYYIKDIKKGTGSFVRINDTQVIDKDYVFSFCNSHMMVYKPKSDNFLHFKFLMGSYKNKLFIFNPREYKLVRVGRSKQAEVIYKDESVSRFQITFIFENNRWFVNDGYDDKPSTNGLWMFASKKIAFYDGMVFKTGNTTFKASIV